MRMELKRNRIDSRYLRARTAPRTRLERTHPMPPNGNVMRKTGAGKALTMAAIIVLAITIAGISLVPALLLTSSASNAKTSATMTGKGHDGQADEDSLERLLDSVDSELLTLVNKWNAVPERREARLVSVEDGHLVDERCKDDLESMLEACRQSGSRPVICSAYRTEAEQQALFDDEVSQYIQMGFSETYAIKRAEKSVAVPGTSEHHLGLAIDVVDELNQRLDSTQTSSDTQMWMMENSWKYGFVLRYPSGKEDVTGIVFEPWHYRYVTREVAKEMHESGLCFEEFLEQASR